MGCNTPGIGYRFARFQGFRMPGTRAGMLFELRHEPDNLFEGCRIGFFVSIQHFLCTWCEIYLVTHKDSRNFTVSSAFLQEIVLPS